MLSLCWQCQRTSLIIRTSTSEQQSQLQWRLDGLPSLTLWTDLCQIKLEWQDIKSLDFSLKMYQKPNWLPVSRLLVVEWARTVNLVWISYTLIFDSIVNWLAGLALFFFAWTLKIMAQHSFHGWSQNHFLGFHHLQTLHALSLPWWLDEPLYDAIAKQASYPPNSQLFNVSSRFSVCNIEKLGIGPGTRLGIDWATVTCFIDSSTCLAGHVPCKPQEVDEV